MASEGVLKVRRGTGIIVALAAGEGIDRWAGECVLPVFALFAFATWSSSASNRLRFYRACFRRRTSHTGMRHAAAPIARTAADGSGTTVKRTIELPVS